MFTWVGGMPDRHARLTRHRAQEAAEERELYTREAAVSGVWPS